MAVPLYDLHGGVKLPAIGLGTFTVTDEKELENALDIAFEIGYRHIDTAYLYNNEHIIGKVLKKWFDAGKLKREDVFITTKLPMQGVNPNRVEKYLKKSLEALQLDYVDLYLIHLPICAEESDAKSPFIANPEPTDHIAVWKKMEEQVKAGKTKTIGVSNFNKAQVERILKNCTIKPAANQVELHVYLQQPELVKFCQENGIVVTSYFSLGNNGLDEFMKKLGRQPTKKPNLLEDPVVNKIAENKKKSPAQVLLRFLLQKNIALIPKSTNEKRLKENIDLFNFTLDSDEMKALEALDKGEEGRRGRMDFNKKYTEHPEYPYPLIKT